MKLPETFKREGSHAGDLGWGMLAAGVIAWDVFAPETLSSAADRYLERPLGRIATLGVVAVVAAHVANGFDHLPIPDPIQAMSDLLAGGTDEPGRLED